MVESEYLDRLILPPSLYRKIERVVIDMYFHYNIKSVPVDPFDIAKREHFALTPISKVPEDLKKALKKYEYDGMSFYYTPDHLNVIVYDDSACIQRQKFTVMHELGHIYLGHKEESELAKECANYFAAYALAPTPLIWYYNCTSELDIQKIFDITDRPATIRFSAYKKWMKIKGFSEMEKELLNLFPKEK